MKKNNINVLENLTGALDEMNIQNNEIDLNSMYGIFLSESGNFIICKECEIPQDDNLYIKEFFTNERIERGEVRLSRNIYPWREGRFYSWHFLEMAFSVPLIDLMGKISENETVTEKDLACLYAYVNKYINENDNFIDQLFNNDNQKVR